MCQIGRHPENTAAGPGVIFGIDNSVTASRMMLMPSVLDQGGLKVPLLGITTKISPLLCSIVLQSHIETSSMSNRPDGQVNSFTLQLGAMTRLLPLAVLATLFLLVSCGATRNDGSSAEAKPKVEDEYANFHVDFMRTDRLSEALDKAKAENKLVFVDFYTSWCLPCKLMDEDVFTDRQFGDYMNANFISLKVDAEAGNGPNLASLFSVQAYPTLLFLDPNGRVQARKEGAAYQTELRRLGNQALAGAN